LTSQRGRVTTPLEGDEDFSPTIRRSIEAQVKVKSNSQLRVQSSKSGLPVSSNQRDDTASSQMNEEIWDQVMRSRRQIQNYLAGESKNDTSVQGKQSQERSGSGATKFRPILQKQFYVGAPPGESSSKCFNAAQFSQPPNVSSIKTVRGSTAAPSMDVQASRSRFSETNKMPQG